MLDIAIKHEDELKKAFRNTWFVDKYKFHNAGVYYSDIKIEDETWNKHQYVSLDRDGNVIGYIGYKIDRSANNCFGLNIINFTDNKLIFGADLSNAIADIFEEFKFRKLTFSVIVGNPVEKSYDKLIERYGGRIVGVFLKHVKLVDGEYYDEKYYEISRDDYLKRKESI